MVDYTVLLEGLNWTVPTVVLMLLTITLLYRSFEKHSDAKTIAFLGVYTALVVVSRQIIHGLGEFTPVFFLVIIFGYVYGGLYGFIVGSTAMLVSNFLLGQGPWTLFQMTGMGGVGLIAAYTPKTRYRKVNTLMLLTVAVMTALIYGLVTDLFFLLAFVPSQTLDSYLKVVAAGLPADTSRAVSTVLFMLVIGQPLTRVLERFRKRFNTRLER